MASRAPIVFISYTREDLDSARRLNNDLKSLGFTTWFDKDGILPGEKWEIAIKKAIENSRYFLAILSSNSIGKKGYVQKELAKALDLLDEFPHSEIFVIPIRLDDCTPSHEKLKQIHWADMFPDWQDGLAKILSTLRQQEKGVIDQPNVSDGELRDKTLDIPDKITSSVIVCKDNNESSESNKHQDTKDLYFADIMHLLPTTDLTLVSLSFYFKLTGQDIKWAM
jgi:hypothetical protein